MKLKKIISTMLVGALSIAPLQARDVTVRDTPSLERAVEDPKVTRIFCEDGEYSPTIDVTKKEIYGSPRTEFKDGEVFLHKDSSIDGVTFTKTSITSTDADVYIENDFTTVTRCFFEGNGYGDGLQINASSSCVTIDGNSFDNYLVGARVNKKITFGEPVFTNNTFQNCRYGIWSWTPQRLSLGSDLRHGNNRFRNNERGNMKLIYSGEKIDAVGNEWSPLNSTSTLTSEKGILDSIYITNLTRDATAEQVDVVPFLVNFPIATFSDTQTANSQSGNWNGILIWDEHEGLVGWKNSFGNVSMPYEFNSDSWKWLNFYDFDFGGWVDQTVNYRNKVAERRVSDSPKRDLVGTTQGYDIEADSFHYVCIRDMETGYNDVQLGNGNWTVEIPKSDSFKGVSIYDPEFKGWTDVFYAK